MRGDIRVTVHFSNGEDRQFFYNYCDGRTVTGIDVDGKPYAPGDLVADMLRDWNAEREFEVTAKTKRYPHYAQRARELGIEVEA